MRDPRDAGIERCTLEDLRGTDAASNAARLREALAGRDTAAHRDALVLGAALALEVTGAGARCAPRRRARARGARERRRREAARRPSRRSRKERAR